MNTAKTRRLVIKNRVVALKADQTNKAPEAEELLVELGNPLAMIPFYAIFPGDGREPIVMKGVISQSKVLLALETAGPSNDDPQVSGAPE